MCVCCSFSPITVIYRLLRLLVNKCMSRSVGRSTVLMLLRQRKNRSVYTSASARARAVHTMAVVRVLVLLSWNVYAWTVVAKWKSVVPMVVAGEVNRVRVYVCCKKKGIHC